MIAIQNERLEVQIQKPGISYQRSRFDWNGICQQITLDGSQTYCSREAWEDDPGTEGVGLSDEFGINTPVGYEETGIGEWFPKIGIGFLQKTNRKAYDFMQDYPIEPAQICTEQDQDHQIRFLQTSKKHNGWGWKLQKTLSLTESTLTIAYKLKNTGDKTIQTETYNHNFLAINANSIGPDYQLRVPFVLQPEPSLGPITTNGNLLTLNEIPKKFVYALQEHCNPKQAVEWQLIHQPSGQGVRVTEKFILFKFAIWGMRHVISPEFFVWINLTPGKEQSWVRQYTFF